MRHAFIMNCHIHLQQAAVTTALYRRYWHERSSLFFYYDGKSDFDPALMEAIQSACDFTFLGPYEKQKSQSLLNAMNVLVAKTAEWDFDVVSFVHEDMIPLYRVQFYAFLERFWRSGHTLTNARIWPAVDYVDFCNQHIRPREAMARGLFPVQNLAPEIDFNEYQITRSFDTFCPDWRKDVYSMWCMTWPITGAGRLYEGAPAHYPQSADKIAHDGDGGTFLYQGYSPESTMIHVNEPYFWDNYTRFSDAEDPQVQLGLAASG